MKKIIIIITVLITVMLNLNVAKQSLAFKGETKNLQFIEKAYASGGANCWSQTKTQEGSSVLRCVVCTYKENSIGVGLHDGKCPVKQQ